MRYCEHCGTPHECEAEEVTRTNPEVEIARINADRDKYVARVSARMNREELDTAEEIAEVEAEAEVEAAVAEAETVAAAVEAGVVDEPEPVIIDASGEEPADEEPEDAPPEAEPEPREHHRRVGLGVW